MTRPKAALRAVLAAALVPLGAGAGAAGGEARARARDGRLALVVREYAELPRKLEAPAGRVTFVLRNRGILDHDLAVKRGVHTLAHLAPVAPGGSGTVSVRLRPGTYLLTCTLWRHGQLGEHATLIVR